MKIPVTRAREEASKRGDFSFSYTSSNTNPSTQLFTSPSVRKEVAHNKKITLEISPKTLDFFPKNSHVFLFFSYVFPTLLEKNKKRSIRFLTAKSKDQCLSTRIPIWAIQFSGEKHDFLEKSQLPFVQTNKILYLCDIASKSTAHTLLAKSGVLCSLSYLGLPRPLISLRYTTITTDFAIKSRSKRIRNNPSSLNKHVIRKNFYCKASTLNLSPTPQLRHAVVKFLLYDNLLL